MPIAPQDPGLAQVAPAPGGAAAAVRGFVRRHAVVALGVLVAWACIASGYTYVRMIESQRLMVTRKLDSAFWVSAQFNREMQDFALRLAMFDGSAVALDTIRLKLEIAIGRVNLLQRADTEPRLEPAMLALAGGLQQDLIALDAPLAALDPTDVVQARRLATTAARVAGQSAQVMIRAHQLDALYRGNLAEAAAAAHQAFLIALLSLVGSFLLMLRALVWQARRLDRTGEQLRQALSRAEAGIRAKAAFLATMSHEIRTPMNGVLGAASLLARTPLDEAQRRAVDIVQGCGEALMAQLDDVLDFSALEAGRADVHPELCEVRGFAASTCAMLETAAAQKGIDLALLVDAAVPVSLVFDYRRMRQVLLNLLSNAIKFTASGGVVVRLSLRGGAGGTWLRVAVADSGRGIPPGDRPRIFEEFSRLSDPSGGGARGSGLGLAISKLVVQRLGGHIGVVSAPGRGSTFVVRIPVTQASVSLPEPAPLPRGRAVVAGSTPAVRQALAQILAGLGFPPARPGEAATLCLAHIAVPDSAVPPGARVIRFGADGTAETQRRVLLSQESVRLWLADTPPSASRIAPPDSAAAPLRLLIVDDDEINREVAASLMRFIGHTVATAPDGDAGLAAVLAEPFDCALIDRHMPGLNGEALARAIRAVPPPAGRLPLIAVTADAGQEARAILLAAGFDAVLTKPVTLDRLTGAIASARTGTSAGADALPGGGLPPVLDSAIRDDLRRRMPAGRLEAVLRTFWEQVLDIGRTLEPGSLRHGERALHALAGSAATLGYAEAADAARHCATRLAAPQAGQAMDAMRAALTAALRADRANLPPELAAQCARALTTHPVGA